MPGTHIRFHFDFFLSLKKKYGNNNDYVVINLTGVTFIFIPTHHKIYILIFYERMTNSEGKLTLGFYFYREYL